MEALNIKYEDSEMILVVKPAGVATESRSIREKDMLSMVKSYRVERGEPNYVGMLHRLDQPVGGLLLFAKTKEAAAKLSKQIQDGTAEKYYQALLCGRIEEEGELTDYLLRDGKTNVSRVVEKGTPRAKKASLTFRRLKVFSQEAEGAFGTDCQSEVGSVFEKNSQSKASSMLGKNAAENQISLVEIRLATGRHHQIRVQMAHHGFPLLGDKKYGVLVQHEAHTDTNRTLECHTDLPQYRDFNGKKLQGPALFAWRLEFRHPKTGKWMDFTEEPPWILE